MPRSFALMIAGFVFVSGCNKKQVEHESQPASPGPSVKAVAVQAPAKEPEDKGPPLGQPAPVSETFPEAALGRQTPASRDAARRAAMEQIQQLKKQPVQE